MCISCTNLLIMLMCQHSRCAGKTLMPDHCSPSWLGLRIKFLLLSVFWVSESSSCSDCCLGIRIKPALIVFCFLKMLNFMSSWAQELWVCKQCSLVQLHGNPLLLTLISGNSSTCSCSNLYLYHRAQTRNMVKLRTPNTARSQ